MSAAGLKKLLVSALFMVLFAYSVFGALLYFKQKDILFFPPRLPDSYVYEFSIPFEEHGLERPGGVEIAGLYFPLQDARGSVIFYNGNAGHAGQHEDFVQRLQLLGQRVYIFDHRSFGKSGGELEAGPMLADTLAVHDYVASRHRDQPVHVIGYSLGSVMATNITANRDTASLTLFAPFHSVQDMAARRFMPVPEFLIDFPFDNEVALQATEEPVLIFHGTSDNVVPVESGRLLKPALKEGDQFFEIEGQTHRDIRQPRLVWEELSRLFRAR